MTRATIDISSEQKQAFKTYFKSKLQNIFEQEIFDVGETQAKLNLLNNKDAIIDNLVNIIAKDVPLSFKYYWRDGSQSETFNIMHDIYIKTYNETFRAYKLKQSAQKEHYTSLIYNEITKDIELSEYDLENTILYIKTLQYKKNLMNDLIKEEDNFNIDLFNSIFDKIRNKVIKEYKQDLEIEKARIQEQNKIDIPLGWKICGLTEIVNKIFKI